MGIEDIIQQLERLKDKLVEFRQKCDPDQVDRLDMKIIYIQTAIDSLEWMLI